MISGLCISRMFVILRRCKYRGFADTTRTNDRRIDALKGSRYRWRMHLLCLQSTCVLHHQVLPMGIMFKINIYIIIFTKVDCKKYRVCEMKILKDILLFLSINIYTRACEI